MVIQLKKIPGISPENTSVLLMENQNWEVIPKIW
jgi:hypothetical protein